jgi:hypothetical protein
MSTTTEAKTVQIGNRWSGAVMREAPATSWGAPDLRDADLRDADLRDADLSGAVLRGADLRAADRRDADLSGAVLRGADLRGADLRDADLRGAVLRDAVLRGADLRDADLRDADLSGAVLRGAVLRGADLRGADLRDADLRGAVLSGTTTLPDGASWRRYLDETVPALLAVTGKPLESFRESWECHQWTNCPMAHAFDVRSLSDVPLLYRPRVNEFVAFFDSGLLGWEVIEAAIQRQQRTATT